MKSILDSYVKQKEQMNNLNANANSLNWENQRLKDELNRVISEPYYIKAMDFRRKVKKTFIYKIYSRVRYGRMEEKKCVEGAQQERQLEFNYDYTLSSYEYSFLKYKKLRNNGYKLNLNKISVPYIKELVSIVLPVYNGDDYVDLAIDSVLSQTYKNFELIIVDDGSTDKTPQIVDAYALKDSRIKVIHQENRKLPRTLSRGFREARGELFTWTSADNIMHPQFLEKFVADMKKYEHTGMIYGNLHLIDEKGNPKTDFEWYPESPENLDNVILPKCILELNTYANNFIGAAFMYRATAACVVEDYSQYKYGIEDYDYWMKINDLFTLRHASFEDIEYSYRMHSKSLTSKDKELKITENRYKQMLLDTFRRDYYIKPLYWIVDTDDAENPCYKELCTAIKKNGHFLITKEDMEKQTENLYERPVYVNFSKNGNVAANSVVSSAYKVLVTSKNESIQSDMFDVFICNEDVTEKDFILPYKGWFGIKEGADIFAFVDSKAKNTFLYELEGDAYSCGNEEKEISILITYCGDKKQLRECLDSIPEDGNKEIIIVADCASAEELKELEDEKTKIVSTLSSDDTIKKNIAARVACGKYLLFLQSDCCLEIESLDNITNIFSIDPKVAVIFGNVEINTRKKYQSYSNVLGEYSVQSDDLYEYQDWNIPSSYTYAVRTEMYKMVGGFYNLTEEVQKEFCNRTMFGLAMALKNVGKYLYLSENFTVLRKVDEVAIKQIPSCVASEKKEDYLLKICNVLPYNVWPEVLRAEIDTLKDKVKNDEEDLLSRARLQASEGLIEMVRDDFRNKTKVDVHRDMFSQLV